MVASAELSGSPSAVPVDFPIVVLGASAGGLDAFKRFLAAMPAEPSMALVLVPHLDPRHESMMAELLTRQTRMPVVEARHRMRIQANHVYIIPPNKYLAVKERSLLLSKPAQAHKFQTAIDFALQSVAEDRQERAIGVILSGTGSHGTSGLKEIKLAGGMIMVQDPATAEYDQMPRNAIATGLVDYVLAPEKMPATLIKYARHGYLNGDETAPAAEAERDALNRILVLLKARTKYDFRHYRKNMMMRRVQRRMGLLNLEQVQAYVRYLRDHPAEMESLYKDLLIGVTAFFREPEAFDVLAEKVIPEIVKQANPDRPIRVWVPGCATGEEAYSIAMLLTEQLRESGRSAGLQVFATDLDESSLDVGRQGSYPESIAANVSPARLKRFFSKKGDHYQVDKQLRDSIVFAPQNLISDAPFSRLDLISCRNVLIYLEADIQTKVISLFRFALNEDGYLLLGPSESVGSAVDMFEAVSRRWRVYRRVGPARRGLISVPIIPTTGRQIQPPLPEQVSRPHMGLPALMQKVLVEDFAPASALINRKQDILAVQGALVDFLEFPPGEMTQNLPTMARQGLRTRIRSAVRQAVQEGRTVRDAEAWVKRDGGYAPCTLTVRPLTEPKTVEGLLLVVFEDRIEGSRKEDRETGREEDIPLVRQLEDELRTTREDLQGLIEELESSNEELKASNEEVMSMNEELQSANEELETSKEELQSLNEELSTVNSQLQDKVEELNSANDDMANLMTATEISTIFLDPDLRIKRFTPPTGKLLSLLESDMGRPLQDFAWKFDDEHLIEDCNSVLETLRSCEREIRSEEGHWYLRRILPYRTADDHIGGAVITFIDITARKEAELEIEKVNATLEQSVAARTADLGRSQSRLQAILDAAVDGIVTANVEGTIEGLNAGAARMFGVSQESAVGLRIGELLPALGQAGFEQAVRGARSSGVPRSPYELEAKRGDGGNFPVEVAIRAVEPLDLYTLLIHDITERKALQKEILRVATLEQRRIGQELHDSIQQELTGLALLAENLSENEELRNTGSGREFVELVRNLSAGIERVNEEVHALAEGLVPVHVGQQGLAHALRDFVRKVAHPEGMRIRFSGPRELPLEDDEAALQLYRIAQEAVSNAVKHAKAKEVEVCLEALPEGVRLVVRDDGIGIETATRERSEIGLGLRIMRYRCALIGGEMSVEQAARGGTVVTCAVPVISRVGDAAKE
jgi:two-component system CheB/CheR fusion protein